MATPFRLKACAALALVVSLFVGTLNAGYLASLGSDSGVQVSGSANYSYYSPGHTRQLAGSIDYAVYDTQAANYNGDFGTIASSAGGQYVYAYQIFNNQGNIAVENFNIFMSSSSSVYLVTTDNAGETSYIDAADYYKNEYSYGTSVNYNFGDDGTDPLFAGSTSTYLIIISDSGWTMAGSGDGSGGGVGADGEPSVSYTIAGGGICSNYMLIPEPAMLCLMGLGGVFARKVKKS